MRASDESPPIFSGQSPLWPFRNLDVCQLGGHFGLRGNRLKAAVGEIGRDTNSGVIGVYQQSN